MVQKQFRLAIFTMIHVALFSQIYLAHLLWQTSEPHEWILGEWLINYQGGFIRRGLLGEILFQLSHLLSINVVHLTIIAQIIVFAVFLYSTYFLIKESPLSPATVALIFFTSVSSLYCLVMALRQCTKGGVSLYYPGIHLPLSAKINTKRVQLAYSYWNKRYRTRAHR